MKNRLGNSILVSKGDGQRVMVKKLGSVKLHRCKNCLAEKRG